MSWQSFAALAYLAIGALVASIAYTAMVGDTKNVGCDDPECKTCPNDVLTILDSQARIQRALGDPGTRVRTAISMCVVLISAVTIWPLLCIGAIVGSRLSGRSA